MAAKRRVDLLADLVAAAARRRARARRAISPVGAELAQRATPSSTIPAASPRQPPCSIATAPSATSSDRQAVGDEHERRRVARARSPGRPRARAAAAGRAARRAAHARAVDLAAVEEALARGADGGGEPLAVDVDVLARVVGQAAEVERGERALRDAAAAGGEQHLAAGQRRRRCARRARRTGRAGPRSRSCCPARPRGGSRRRERRRQRRRARLAVEHRRGAASSARPIAGPSSARGEQVVAADRRASRGAAPRASAARRPARRARPPGRPSRAASRAQQRRRSRTARPCRASAGASARARVAAATAASRSRAGNAKRVEPRRERRRRASSRHAASTTSSGLASCGRQRAARARRGRDRRRTPGSSRGPSPSASSPQIAAGSGSPSSSRSSAPSRGGVTVSSAPPSTASNAPAARGLLDREAQPRHVADQPQQPRRVVEEGALVQHAQAVLPRGPRARRATASSSPSASRTAIALTREVAAREVLGDRRAELDVGQRARMRVALAPRRGEVDRRRSTCRGAEALVDDRVVAEPPRGRPPRRPRPRGRGRAASRPSSVSRTAPPTTQTPGRSASASSTGAAPGSPAAARADPPSCRQLPSQPMSSPDSPRSPAADRHLGRARGRAAAGRRRGRLRPALRPATCPTPTSSSRPSRPRRPPPSPRRADEDDFTWPLYGRTPTAATTWRPRSRCGRRSGAAGRGTRTRCSSSRPCSPRASSSSSRTTAPLYAIDKRNGKVRWRRNLGRLAASTPAYADGRIYVTILVRDGSKNGRVVARCGPRTARALWTQAAAEPHRVLAAVRQRAASTSAPRTARSTRCARATAASRWRYKAAGAVKGASALADGKLYFGDYGGRVHAIRERDGKRVWTSTTNGARFGTSSGQLLRLARRRLRPRLHRQHGLQRLLVLGAQTGKLAWRTGTGGYVYASAAVAQVPGGKPTVYVGSYDARFYALDAQSGKVRWKHKAPGRISGAATVVGDIVYFGDLKSRTTTGLGARTGRKVLPLRPRRLQPRHRRRARPLRGRLRLALAAQAAIGRTLTPAPPGGA